MIFDTLPPVGSRIALGKSNAMDWRAHYPGYTSHFLHSGTAALAAAMQLAKAIAADSYRREVILPAYGCPDLVSAAVYAGLRPVLVDIEPGRPQLSLNALSEALGRNTLAVVAVNFLGLPERSSALRDICHENDSFLIEDNAQWFPEPKKELHGDFVITSFGRGKPISLLGGGMLLVKENIESKCPELFNQRPRAADSLTSRFAFMVKVLAYNTLLSPRCYGLLDLLPLISLGETRYKTLHGIEEMPGYLLTLLPTIIIKYLSKNMQVQRQISSILAQDNSIIDLPATTEGFDLSENRLLRYPILVDKSTERHSLLADLTRSGLGATAMYKTALPVIEGVAEHVQVPQHIPNARDFAARLITLPTHSLVEQRHIDRMNLTFNDSVR